LIHLGRLNPPPKPEDEQADHSHDSHHGSGRNDSPKSSAAFWKFPTEVGGGRTARWESPPSRYYFFLAAKAKSAMMARIATDAPTIVQARPS